MSDHPQEKHGTNAVKIRHNDGRARWEGRGGVRHSEVLQVPHVDSEESGSPRPRQEETGTGCGSEDNLQKSQGLRLRNQKTIFLLSNPKPLLGHMSSQIFKRLAGL